MYSSTLVCKYIRIRQSWPSSYFVPDRASRTRRKRHRVRVGLFKDGLQAKEPTKWIYEGYRPVFVVRCRLDSGYDCFHGLEQTHRFARRARDHARIYRGEYSVASIIDIERIRKKKKSHRGALVQATSSFRSASRISLTKPRRLLSVRWKLNSIRIQQQQQRECPY